MVYPEFANLPNELSRDLGIKISQESLETFCFSVNGNRRIGDLEFFLRLPITQWEQYVPHEDIFKRIKDFTLILE